MIACTPIYRHSFLHLLYNIFSLKIITLREIRQRNKTQVLCNKRSAMCESRLPFCCCIFSRSYSKERSDLSSHFGVFAFAWIPPISCHCISSCIVLF